MTNKILSYESIRGLIAGEGCFSFCTVPVIGQNGRRLKVPAFILQMSQQDKELVNAVKETMGLHNKVYEYEPRITKDLYRRQGMVTLIVRDFGQLKNIVVPFFYKKLPGFKAKQFENWLENIGNDPDVQENYRFIYKIYKAGFYDKNPKFFDCKCLDCLPHSHDKHL